MNYNTNQWLIFNYPIGSGGKFLVTCFLQFEKLAHWSGKQLTPNETIDWYQRSMPEETESWAAKEIDTVWQLPKISRAWPRGENIGSQEFSDSINDTILQDYWNKNLIIPDFWHKTKRPDWWTNAQWINIHIDDRELHKEMLFSKIFEFQNNTVICHDQRPDIGRAINQEHKQIYQNQWIWENIDSVDEFCKNHLIDFPWYQSWNFDSIPTNPYIRLTELFDVDKVYKFMLQFEDNFKQRVSKEYITQLHKIWHKHTVLKLSYQKINQPIY